MHMTEKTFDDLSDGKLSGFMGWFTGRVRLEGPITLASKFDGDVVRRYSPDEGISKTDPRG